MGDEDSTRAELLAELNQLRARVASESGSGDHRELMLKDAAFEASIAANSIADADGVMTEVNQAFLDMFGYASKADAIGNSVGSFFAVAADAGPVLEALGECGEWQGEFLAVRPDGSQFISRGFATVIRDERGELIGYQSANLDVTEQRAAKDELAGRSHQLETIFDSAMVGIIVCRPDGIIVEVNRRGCEMHGFGDGELVGMHASSIVHPDHIATLARFIATVAAGETFATTALGVCKDGTAIDLEVRGAPMMLGDKPHMLAILQDISERKRAELEIELRGRIGAIFLSLPDDEMYSEVLDVVLDAVKSEFGVFGYVDDDGALVVPSMTRDVWRECQVSDKDVVFPRDSWGSTIWPRAMRAKKLLFTNDPSELTPAGHVRITRNVAAPIVHHGEVVGLLHIANKASDYTPQDIALIETLRDIVAPILAARLARDRQERKRRHREQEIIALNRELDQRVAARTAELTAVNRELEAFAYSVSHDLRAPLRGIDGFSKALLDDYDHLLDDTGRDYIARVRAGTQRMGRLIDDLLRLSRLTRAEMHLQRLALDELAAKITGELERDEPEREVEFTIASDLVAHGDRVLVAAALENLLRNSWKFTGERERAHIELGVEDGDGERVYYVRDDGAGFDMAYADQLFGAFQRLHDATEFPGSGIGLAIVKRVINRHGGRIWAEAEVGRGATFYFTLPSAPETVLQPERHP